MNKGKCSIEGCNREAVTRGWCDPHYKRWMRHGDPLAGGLAKGSAPAFLKKAEARRDEKECLIWPYGKTKAGYGVLMLKKTTYAHILVCERVHGPKPTGHYEVAHSCGNPSCVNPHHLRWATPSENQLDKRIHGTHNHGERNPNCKLSDADVRDILRLKGKESGGSIARRYGVSPSRINGILAGKARKRETGDFS